MSIYSLYIKILLCESRYTTINCMFILVICIQLQLSSAYCYRRNVGVTVLFVDTHCVAGI
jgi:hypothetical protein